MNKFFSFLFIFCLSFTLLTADGVQPVGSGTETDPYQIATLDNLLWLSTTEDSWSSHFIQTADIDASATENWNDGEGWSPIGSEDGPGFENTPFNGHYDGQGHYIDGLYINSQYGLYLGFFGYISHCEINNLIIQDYSYTCNYSAGGLAGSTDNSIVTNCSTSGSINGGSNIGGLIGMADDSNISFCSSSSEISALGYMED